MTTAHFYVFSDACPSDWLVDGKDDEWHTIVNFSFQSDPQLWPLITEGRDHEEVLAHDCQYQQFIAKIQSELPSGKLMKWSTGPGYRERFCRAFTAAVSEFMPQIAACSFQENVLRMSKPGLIGSYNKHIGGVEGRGIGFEEYLDSKGRRRMKHKFLGFHGLPHIIAGLENQILVLLFMAWFIADQYFYRFRDIISGGRYGFTDLNITLVSDKLSGDGDDDFRRKNEANLRHLIDPEGSNAPLTLTRSRTSDTFSGDLIVDNLAGWLTAAMEDTAGSFANYAREIAHTGVWGGWYHLQPSMSQLEAEPAINRLLGP